MNRNENTEINKESSRKWLESICALLKDKNSNSTKSISDLFGFENKTIERDKRGSKFLIPFNKNLKYIAVNPDLTEFEEDKPLTYLSFSGENLKLNIKDLIEYFPNIEIVQNDYDGGIQLFFNPVNDQYDFKAVSCELLVNCRTIAELKDLEINHIAFLFNAQKIKTRAGYTMIE